MEKNTRSQLGKTSLGVALLLGLSACGDKETATGPDGAGQGNHQLLHSVIVENNSFLSRFKDLSVGATDNNNAITLSQSAFLYPFADLVLTTSLETDQVLRFDRSGGQDLVQGGRLEIPGAYPYGVTIANSHKAYVSYQHLGQIGVINLDTMTETKRIDLSPYALGDGDNNPEPANSILRDGKLYVALLQEISAFNPHPGAHVVIIDTAADTVIKAISDPRTLSIDGGGTTGSPFMDEKGDLYFYGYGLWGFNTALDGFLRIRKGEDEFDPTYFFSIKDKTIPDVPGNNASYLYIRTYWGNGVIYGFLNIPANTSNPPDYVNDRNYQPFRIDLYNQVFEKVDLPPTTGWSTCLTRFGGLVVWGMNTAKGTGYFTLDPKTGKTSPTPVVTTAGAPYRLFTF